MNRTLNQSELDSLFDAHKTDYPDKYVEFVLKNNGLRVIIVHILLLQTLFMHKSYIMLEAGMKDSEKQVQHIFLNI